MSQSELNLLQHVMVGKSSTPGRAGDEDELSDHVDRAINVPGCKPAQIAPLMNPCFISVLIPMVGRHGFLRRRLAIDCRMIGRCHRFSTPIP
jgi:hypothetical protein